MGKIGFVTLTLAIFTLALCVSPISAEKSDESQKVKLDQPVENFALKDYNGKEYQLSEFKGKKGVLVIFIATQCPYSNAYNERMVKLYNNYLEKGIQIIGINSNKQESIEEVAKHSKDHSFKFPVLKDLNNVIADRFVAQVTPEAYLLDEKWILRYHGWIDSNHQDESKASKDLRAALDALLAGKEIPKKETKAFGCTIKRVK